MNLIKIYCFNFSKNYLKKKKEDQPPFPFSVASVRIFFLQRIKGRIRVRCFSKILLVHLHISQPLCLVQKTLMPFSETQFGAILITDNVFSVCVIAHLECGYIVTNGDLTWKDGRAGES